jgi:hypothetical protein
MSLSSLTIKSHRPVTQSQLAEGVNPSVLTKIYNETFNIAVWQRDLDPNIKQVVASFIEENPTFQTSMTVTVNSATPSLIEVLGETEDVRPLVKDAAKLVEMFCYLFEQQRVGLRLTVLNHAMCPRFHVDRVPCRLVTTYQGSATQWLPNTASNRSKLGHGNGGLPDHESGLYAFSDDVQQLKAGDVSLLKGEEWEGNEGAGLIHRSPSNGSPRLLLTLDFNA